MELPDIVWGGLLAIGAGVEIWALRNGKPGDTLSERTRYWFHVKSPVGRAVFGVVWVVFSVWFLLHILGQPS